jgi:hypothetical protein
MCAPCSAGHYSSSAEDYLSLAQTWLQLATIFENDDALLKGWGKSGSNLVPFAKRSRRPIKVLAS